jgi:hypothetical protein
MQVEKVVCQLRTAEAVGGIVPSVQGLGVDGITTLIAEDIARYRWPLFLTAREWLVLLDASLHGDRFFNDNETDAALNGSGTTEQGSLLSIGKCHLSANFSSQ